jgi:hypothetical protein
LRHSKFPVSTFFAVVRVAIVDLLRIDPDFFFGADFRS